VLSPNGDGVGDDESLAYKLVRPSTVDARLTGPSLTVPLDAGQRAPGAYKFEWTGIVPQSRTTSYPEGTYRIVVTATDDTGQISTADRAFTLNNTLGALTVRPNAVKLRKKRTRVRASFTLARSAKVTVTVENTRGIVVRILSRGSESAGRQRTVWDGRDGSGGLAYGGAYRVHVSAANALGRTDLYAPFRARR
jgi:flagellar hook assembly protein FlgD